MRYVVGEVSTSSSYWIVQMALLTSTQCLRALDPLASHDEIVANLHRLARELDPLRANMYKRCGRGERVHLSCNCSMIEVEKVRRALLTEERSEEPGTGLRYIQS